MTTAISPPSPDDENQTPAEPSAPELNQGKADMRTLHESVAELTAEVRRLKQMIASPTPCPILSVEESMGLTGHQSRQAFYDWCRKWNVVAASHGRWSRVRLSRALDSESKLGQSRRRRRKADGEEGSSSQL